LRYFARQGELLSERPWVRLPPGTPDNARIARKRAIFVFYIQRKEFYKVKNKKVTSNIIMVVMAVVLIVVGVYSLMNASAYARNGVKTEAEITNIVISSSTDGNTNHTVTVEFQVDGKTYGGVLDTYDMSMHVGGKTTVYYMPNDPSDFHSARFNYLPCMACLIAAAVVVLIIAIPYVISRVREAKLDKYREEGTLVVARIAQIERKNTRVNNKTLATLVCMGRDRNEYTQKLLLDGGENYVVGDDIDVYVSANNPKKYIVDTEGYLEKQSARYTDDSQNQTNY